MHDFLFCLTKALYIYFFQKIYIYIYHKYTYKFGLIEKKTPLGKHLPLALGPPFLPVSESQSPVLRFRWIGREGMGQVGRPRCSDNDDSR